MIAASWVKDNPMKRLALISPVALAAIVAAHVTLDAGCADDVADLGIKLPDGYRDWRLISVVHEADKLDDLRAGPGNDIAIEAYRGGKWEFPDGAIIACCNTYRRQKGLGQPHSILSTHRNALIYKRKFFLTMLGIRTTSRQNFLLMISKENSRDSNSATFQSLSTTIGRFLAYLSRSADLRPHRKIPSTPLARSGDSRERPARSCLYSWPSAGANGGASSRP